MIRRSLLPLICLGLLQIAVYYVAGALARVGDGVAVPQPDTLLYCQAARRIAEGHPFSYAPGEPVSTGTTSVAYPFALAALYALGAKGPALPTAGFLLNAVFYLMFLAGWGVAIGEWLKRPLARWTAWSLAALSPLAAYGALSQSDTGMWMAVSALFAAGIAKGNFWLYAAALAVSPWVRPEGMVLTTAFGLVWIARAGCVTEAGGKVRDSAALAVAVASCAGVFALNWSLTGAAQFSSVANKGYFKMLPFSGAVASAAGDLVSIAKGHFLGMARSMPQQLFGMPLLAGILALVGVFAHPWRSKKPTGPGLMMLAAAGSWLVVAQSGWLGTNFDRYLAWTAPVVAVLVAEGAAAAATGLRRFGTFRWLPAAAVTVFAGCAAATAVCVFNTAAEDAELLRQFGAAMEKELPAGASVGAFGGSGVAYELGERPYRHLSGIYSPQVKATSMPGAVEELKHRPELRFDYWMLTPSTVTSAFGKGNDSICGTGVMTGPKGYAVRKADWSAFDASARPVASPQDKHLVCRVDVGYEEDERTSDYQVIDRWNRRKEDPFPVVDRLDGKRIIDVARLVEGGDAMTVPLKAGSDAVVVMRTYPKHTRKFAGGETDEVAFANPLKLNLAVDGQLLPPVNIAIATNGFSESSFVIPGSAIKTTPTTVSLLGDHIACGYWFYQ